MNSLVTTWALLLFAIWIAIAFVLAQRRLDNAYSSYQKEDKK